MRYISVPVTVDAMKRLDVDQCIEGDLVKTFFNEVEYEAFWKSGIADIINCRFDVIIDDYEDEELTNMDQLIELKEIVEEFLLKDSENIAFNKLMDQVNNAINFKTGIFFFF